ncbi:MAG TPA: SIMPL domain-containing protein [Baekduia sp.]|nr:SIMPL domain-containing protein [Baekduia sp.]
MPTQFAFRTVAVVAVLAFVAGCLAAVANAQTPVAAPQRTIVADGDAIAKVTPKDKKSNASIVAAIAKAEKEALPRAYKDAQEEAAGLAQVAGVTLGTLLTISNEPPTSPYFGPYGATTGTFGPDLYCGNIRTRSVKIDKNGKRHYGKFRTHRTCRFPSTLSRTVELTYAIA